MNIPGATRLHRTREPIVGQRLADQLGGIHHLPERLIGGGVDMVTDHIHETKKLDKLRQLTENGAITLRVARTLPFDQAAQAHRQLEAGGVRGRLVLQF